MDDAPREAPDQANGAAGSNTAPDAAPPVDVKPLTDKPKSAQPPVSPAPVADGDEVIYHGSVSLWLGWRSFAGAIGAALLGLALLIADRYYGWPWSIGVYIGLPLVIAAGFMFAYVYLSLRCLRYKITGRLIERERGILVKRVDSLDLGRIKDVQLVQNLMERILRIGTIEILSSDRTDPLMRLEAIPAPRPVYEKLRDIVIRISQKRGIIAMDR